MQMVRHQAITIHLQMKTLRRVSQKLQINRPIRIHEEHILTVVAPLDNMMSTTGNHNSCISRHGPISTPNSPSVNPKTSK
jgi:hypothetical protein